MRIFHHDITQQSGTQCHCTTCNKDRFLADAHDCTCSRTLFNEEGIDLHRSKSFSGSLASSIHRRCNATIRSKRERIYHTSMCTEDETEVKYLGNHHRFFEAHTTCFFEFQRTSCNSTTRSKRERICQKSTFTTYFTFSSIVVSSLISVDVEVG